MKRLKNETTTTNPETGEVVTYKKEYSIKTTPDKFYMTFFENLSGFFELKSAIDIKILTILASKAEFNTGKILLPSSIRKDIAIELGIYQSQISRSLSNLNKKELISGSNGEYFLNPLVHWKGDSSIRDKLIEQNQVSVTINFDGTSS